MPWRRVRNVSGPALVMIKLAGIAVSSGPVAGATHPVHRSLRPSSKTTRSGAAADVRFVQDAATPATWTLMERAAKILEGRRKDARPTALGPGRRPKTRSKLVIRGGQRRFGPIVGPLFIVTLIAGRVAICGLVRQSMAAPVDLTGKD